jgi:hypothetical protein
MTGEWMEQDRKPSDIRENICKGGRRDFNTRMDCTMVNKDLCGQKDLCAFNGLST